MTSPSLSDKGVSQEIPEPYLALLLYTPSSQGSRLLYRKHGSLIWKGTGIKKGLSAGGRGSCSVYSVVRKLHLLHYYFWTYHLKLLYIKLLTLFIQRKIYFILKEEKESSSLFDL